MAKNENKKEAGGGQRQERPAAERKKTRKTLLWGEGAELRRGESKWQPNERASDWVCVCVG